MLENVMIQIVHSHVKNLDLIAAIPVMPLVMMVSFVHIQLWWKRDFCFHEKIRFYHKLSNVFINNYLQQVNVPIPLAWKR